eukprot:CAMPEP_0170582940 /NCGR_PEP_ID=MMETSP0224-20130122/7857_1 /TAXON_ID=285029 /ORGANISM="Togula jolla, Strain CCCM 725" /LENGTH=240 /DNA_ID=CAMNT_0010906209 /DNA_START=925 /DNA_END=1647 /DNA_ORIENTATION=-
MYWPALHYASEDREDVRHVLEISVHHDSHDHVLHEASLAETRLQVCEDLAPPALIIRIESARHQLGNMANATGKSSSPPGMMMKTEKGTSRSKSCVVVSRSCRSRRVSFCPALSCFFKRHVIPTLTPSRRKPCQICKAWSHNQAASPAGVFLFFFLVASASAAAAEEAAVDIWRLQSALIVEGVLKLDVCNATKCPKGAALLPSKVVATWPASQTSLLPLEGLTADSAAVLTCPVLQHMS